MRILREYLIDLPTGSSGLFEFREDCFRFSNEFVCSWINWMELEKFDIDGQDLLLIPKNLEDQIFVINESEVGTTDFKRIIDYINNKVP